jgi:hypothetical protein
MRMGTARTDAPTSAQVTPGNHRRLYVLIAIALVLFTAWRGWDRVTWWTPTGQAIAPVVRAAATFNQTLMHMERQKQYRTPAGRRAGLQRAEHLAARIYTGKRLAFWKATARAMFSQRPGSARMSSTVDWVHLDTLHLISQPITATLSMQTHMSGGTTTRMNYSFHLVHTPHGWRVSDEDFNFAPGSGP